MGLAASQARMLLLTARKSDVEGQLMSISNQKLSLSRQSADVSKEYSNALNQEKLVWNYGGSDKELSYDMMMESFQYLLTGPKGVVLDSDLSSKLGLSGTGVAGDLAKAMNMDTFLQKMGISDSQTRELAIAGNQAIPSNGTPTTGAPAPIVSGFTFNYSDFDIANTAGLGSVGISTLDSASGDETWAPGYSGHAKDDAESNLASRQSLAGTVTNQIFDISDKLGASLRQRAGSVLPSSYQKFIVAAIAYAKLATNNKFLYGINDSDSTDGANLVSQPPYAINYTENGGQNGICIDRWTDKKLLGYMKGPAKAFVDQTQIVKTFLSYFDQYLAQNCSPDVDGDGKRDGGATSKVGGSSTTRGATGGTGTETKIYGTSSEAENTSTSSAAIASTSQSVMAARYLNLYNAINTSGWATDANIDNTEYLKSQVLYGNMTMLQMTSSGWDQLSSGDIGSPLASVPDEDAISQAKADYEADKDQLDYKECQLDLDMNNLDTERSAIETETDSVQKLIDKNIERSFKMFQA